MPLKEYRPRCGRRVVRAAFSWILATSVFTADSAAQDVFPGIEWETRTPAEMGLDAAKLNELAAFVGGHGCVVRGGYMVHTWGTAAWRLDIASAAKPFISHFLFKAVESGLLSNMDVSVADYQPCLSEINAGLDFKDAGITFRHLANQVSCYGVSEAPGTAFDYNDFQTALFWDTLFLDVYGVTYDNVDETLLGPLLTDVLQCQDDPTFMFRGTGSEAGRVGISPRDFARFGLLYLRRGNWNGVQLISVEHAMMAVSSAMSNGIPRTQAVEAEMCPGQRSFGGLLIPDDQADHLGSYSWMWWTNGLDPDGFRTFPDAPVGTFGAFGHGPRRSMWVVPELDIVVSYNNTNLSGATEPGPLTNQAMGLLMDAVEDLPMPPKREVSATSGWGFIITALLLLTAGTIQLHRRTAGSHGL